jgi:uncharacterized protein (TIGR02646 family)
MRPVEKGEAPRVYTGYGQAIGDLEGRIGRYCSYCERRFEIGLAVEHVSPKSKDTDRELDWDNFLLACPNCNAVKSDTETNVIDFLWPDKDNTLAAIRYSKGGLVEANPDAEPAVQSKATKLIELVGLDRHPGQPPGKKPAERDMRYSDREQNWTLAIIKREALSRNDNQDFREIIADLAVKSGFFGVWYSVFFDDVDMRKLLVEAAELAGTAKDCFDADHVVIPRPGGHC